ncbi:MAG TPA: peptide-methionine (S)-S-oxide reductase MsrA [Candidatus Saccharibacteria bacterium]|nr:peptide-methionine (S)-S-oxide reductase MsrA [Candidatus Saccharibacteria bacterium]HMT39832.1 peptide-methionine (S)-S-oxide reductase MsrA [Candidatus Saccharibacteria bacterium]
MKKNKIELANFGGGCFWGVEEVFRTIPGVVKTTVGYEGGHVDNPTYEQVCSHTTGHAETVQVAFDPKKVGYDKLLDVFFENHDPTQLNKQGFDVGDNYRSVIFYHGHSQKKRAEQKIAKIAQSKRFDGPIVTELVPAKKFWHAEEYHQKYLHKRNLEVC